MHWDDGLLAQRQISIPGLLLAERSYPVAYQERQMLAET